MPSRVNFDALPIRVEPMTVSDLGDVLSIERSAYPSPWSARAYEYELRYNEMAHYFVARPNSPRAARSTSNGVWSWLKRALRPPQANGVTPHILGYVGYWLMAGEAHISTIAVRPELRGRSYGELLLAYTIQDAAQRSAHIATLEVRVSNQFAQALYLKYGFEKVGMRKAYYSDNNEDAYIMTTPTLNSAAYQQKFQWLTAALFERLKQNAAPVPARAI